MKLKVSKIHTLDMREFGDKSKPLVLYCHGGPGAEGFDELYKYVDLRKYFFVSYDQRGCGRSTPFMDLRNNTTKDLIEDINKILNHYKKKEVIIIGDSWGTTLALAYSIKNPEKVKGLIFGGLFLGRDKDLKWLYEDSPKKYYQEFKRIFNHDPLSYEDLLLNIKNKKNIDYYTKLAQWEEFLYSLSEYQHKNTESLRGYPIYQSLGKMCSHYFTNNCFLEKDELIKKENLDNIKNIPIALNHGIYDRVCLIDQSEILDRLHTKSKLFPRKMKHFTFDHKYNQKIYRESFQYIEEEMVA